MNYALLAVARQSRRKGRRRSTLASLRSLLQAERYECLREVKRKNTAPYRFTLKFEVKFAKFGFKFYAPRPVLRKRKFKNAQRDSAR